MAVIYYGLAGEGRGHASRAHTLIEHLRKQHRLTVLTFGQATEMLAPLYQDSDVELDTIEGMCLHYNALGRVSKLTTVARGLSFLTRLEQRAFSLAQEMEARGTTLVISDYEPITARAAQIANIPWISIDHQRMLGLCDLSGLSLRLRSQAAVVDRCAQHVFGSPYLTIVSGFYLPRPAMSQQNVHYVGALLRPEVLAATPENGNHLVAYLRRNCPRRVLETLSSLNQPVHAYGLGPRPSQGSLQFKPISSQSFLSDLASSCALISTAGNQLLGEAMYLGKPVLAFPEPGNFEQEINAHFLNRSGAGKSVPHFRLTPRLVQTFLDELSTYVGQIVRKNVCGNELVCGIIDSAVPKDEHGAVPDSRVQPLRLVC